jgi:hypothetical protein
VALEALCTRQQLQLAACMSAAGLIASVHVRSMLLHSLRPAFFPRMPAGPPSAGMSLRQVFEECCISVEEGPESLRNSLLKVARL